MPNIPPKPSEFELFMPVIVKSHKHNGLAVYIPERPARPGHIWVWAAAQEQPEGQRPDMETLPMVLAEVPMQRSITAKTLPPGDDRIGLMLARFKQFAQEDEDMFGNERKVVLQLVFKDAEKFRKKRWPA